MDTVLGVFVGTALGLWNNRHARAINSGDSPDIDSVH